MLVGFLFIKVASLCPSIHPGNWKYKCTKGFQYGSLCYRICPVGFDKPPGESGVMLCQANGKWRGHFPDCKVVHRRVNDPDPPKNGAVASDTWLDGKFCQVQCRKDYDFKPGYTFYEMLLNAQREHITAPSFNPAPSVPKASTNRLMDSPTA
uniref:Uncharacterized protein n=1 Tax=Magallana gigas TaxID=29159 RepID=K1PV65_MAGGI